MTAQRIFSILCRTVALLLPLVAAGAHLGGTPHLLEVALLQAESARPLPGIAPSSLQALSRSIHRAVPSEVDPEARYVIYLHGRIIEDEGVRPTHPRFGVYEYEAILEELAGHGLEVIGEVRPPSADGAEYARRTAQQVRELIAAGVPEDHITVMGFSKGGAIAILTSWELQEPAVRYVWLAACGDWAFRMSALVPAGRILSIHEASDELGVSCEPLFGRSDLITAEEVRIDTGEQHGAFYRPVPEWVAPAVEWIRGMAGPGGLQVAAAGAEEQGATLSQEAGATLSQEQVPGWVTLLGYEADELFSIHTGRFGYPYVIVVINGVTFDLPFDTGNMVGLNLGLEEIDPLGLETAESWNRLSSDGQVVGTFSSFSGATVEVWGEVRRDQQVFEFDDPDLPGLLGPQYLLGKRYTLDYKSGIMAISERPLPADITGMESISLVESSRNPGLILFYGTVQERRVLIQADTGKSRGTIDPGLARDLGLQENSRGFHIEDLRIGSHTFEIPSAKGVSLAAIDESLADPILLGIGSDILSRVPVTIDYIAGRLLLPAAHWRGPGALSSEWRPGGPYSEEER